MQESPILNTFRVGLSDIFYIQIKNTEAKSFGEWLGCRDSNPGDA